MKVILTTNIKKLGKVGDLISVKNGFARNFLFPQKKALRNTKNNKEYFDKIRDEIDKKEAKKKDNALVLLNNLKDLKIEFIKEADENNQLYGAVSKKEIQQFLEERDIGLLSDDIKILQTIKSLGEHLIEVSPYEGLIEKIKVFVKKA
ncbi:MAG: 50S ribosomal protein L9 [Pelagibacteraceae bacterium]|jgi:large subunit ribosomal protein L9|nr:50S ribosomal protein L9 [Pelagibacteraceae bacterium]HJO13688.1 50S ribosomal protein L9 [Alphaproteobacteria bacterium]MBO6467095.1 50S ribosomal protein L9 [Pelagibacteraceae bacterium]MBO6468074.1 50S ribosomal protein L9 [Pelagibacteraceae bacterium]MBO6470551.1 50S ribosomal protein L9 [Pelagibacteraceae bacterium]|tara:strand:+ start:75 stop:518 length:444 start_codon:yes stop_codon:yes gene_type:complete